MNKKLYQCNYKNLYLLYFFIEWTACFLKSHGISKRNYEKWAIMKKLGNIFNDKILNFKFCDMLHLKKCVQQEHHHHKSKAIPLSTISPNHKIIIKVSV